METAYIDRLLAELRMHAGSRTINAVFVDGGTPSALSPYNAGRMLKAIGDCLPLANDCELTLSWQRAAVSLSATGKPCFITTFGSARFIELRVGEVVKIQK